MSSHLNASAAGAEPSTVEHRARPAPRTPRVLAITSGLAFIVLAFVASIHPGALWGERGIDDLLRAQPHSPIFVIARMLTLAGSAVFVMAAVSVLVVEAWVRGLDRRVAIASVIGVGLAGVAEILIKPIVARPRPLTSSIVGEHGYGYPSGHATGAAALGVCLAVIVWSRVPGSGARRGLVIAVSSYVVIVGASRVVIGAHRFVDVIGGWLLGAAIAGLVLLGALTGRTASRALNDKTADQARDQSQSREIARDW